MDRLPSVWVALPCDLVSVTVDPATGADCHRGRLPAGTLLEDVFGALRRAERDRLPYVTLRTMDIDGWVGLDRIDAAALRVAFPA